MTPWSSKKVLTVNEAGQFPPSATFPVKTQLNSTHHNSGGHVRHLILALGTLYLSILLGDVICFNPTIVVMMDLKSSPLGIINSSVPNADIDYNSWDLALADRRFNYSNLQKSTLLAAAFGGCLIFILPIGYLMQLFGAHRMQIGIGFAVTASSALIPFAATYNFYALVICRMVVGFALTNFFPVVGSIANQWSSPSERGLFLGILSGYIQLSCIISMPLSGFLSSTFGWPSVFYVHAFLSLILTILWTGYYRDNPHCHPCISNKELTSIDVGRPKFVENEKYNPPYSQILLSRNVWAIMIAVIANFLVIQFANTFLPMFLRSALKFTNEESGLLSALPLLIQFIMKSLTGFVTDRIPSQRVSDLIKVRFCNSVAFFGTALFFILATLFNPITSRFWIVLFLTMAIATLGLNSGGWTKSVVLVSKQFTPTTMCGVQIFLCITIFSASFVVPKMTPDETFDQYRYVFWIYIIALVITNVVFVLFGGAKPAKWTEMIREESTGVP